MKLRNPLTSLRWNLLRRPGARLRRRRPARAPACLAAEILEQRQLLSAANVNLSVLAGAITLSATDNNNHSLAVHRVDSTNVEFDVSGGTQITYLGVVHTSSFNVAIPTVLSVTANLGGGFDTYNIFDLSTLGNVTFNGHLGGEIGDDLNVYSQSANVVIGGSVVFNVGNQTGVLTGATASPSPLAPAASSFEDVFSCTGNLTVNGNITVTESGAAGNEVDVFTNATMSWESLTPMTTMGSGNLTVNGSLLLNQSGTGNKENDIYTDGPGSLTINGGVSITQSGSGDHSSQIYTAGGGGITIGFGGVFISDFGSGDHTNRIYTTSSGSILIKGSVSVFDSGTAFNEFDIQASNTVDAGDVTIGGSVYYSNALNTTGHDAVVITADTGDGSGVVTINGALTLLLSNNASAGNFVQLGGDGDESETQVAIGGPVLLTSGAGADDIGIDSVLFRSMVTINTGTNPASIPAMASTASPLIDSVSADFLSIEGSTFNSLVSISMFGRGAMIDVNNVSGTLPTVFNGPVSIFMQGPNAAIFLSNGIPDGTAPVVFNSTLTVTGGIGGFPAGTLFIQGPVHFAFAPLLINFNEATAPI